MLDGVRAALAACADSTSKETRSLGLNLGIISMFLGTLPPLAAVLMWSIGPAAAFAMLLTSFATVLFGSGTLLNMFCSDKLSASREFDRVTRKEFAFGSTLMFLGTILATCLVATLPGRYEAIGFLTFIPAMFLLLLFSSRWLFDSYIEMGVGTDSSKSISDRRARFEQTTGSLVSDGAQLNASTIADITIDVWPPSVTEGTTRHLDAELIDTNVK
jgi:hypothetical protein